MPVYIGDHAILSHGNDHNRLLRNISIELLPEQIEAFSPNAICFPKRSLVFLTHIPGKPIAAQREAAKLLLHRGFEPVPHLAARNFKTADEYADHLRSLTAAGVRTVLMLGGNPSSSIPPLKFAADLLKHPVMDEVSLDSVFMAGHPEGHSVIPDEDLFPSLREKIELVRARNMKPQIATQFAFDGDVMGSWAEGLRQGGVDVPLRFGMAGVTSLPKLIKFAAMCGVGASLTALTRQGTSLLKAMRDQEPGDVIASLNASLARRGVRDVSLHFFPFGGWEKTLKWIDGQLANKRQADR